MPDEGRSFSSYGDVLNGLTSLGVMPEEIQAVYKVSALDSSFSVMLSYADSVGDLLSHGEVRNERNRFKIMRMSGQVVTVRIHWLPIYFDNSILKEILSQYGEVVEIRMLKSAHAEVVAFDGVSLLLTNMQ